MHKILEINPACIEELILEIQNNTFSSENPAPFLFSKKNTGTIGLTLNNDLKRSLLEHTFNVINSGIVLSSITPKELGIDLFVNDLLIKPLLWTYPQLRIDCEVNKSFSSPWHKDVWILGEKMKGVIIWMPVSENGGTLEIIDVEEPLPYTIIKNDYWGLEAKFEEGAEKNHVKKIHVKYGQALIFDESLIHKSSPLEDGQLTLQLRYFDFPTEDFYRPVIQKITEKVKQFQNSL